MHRLSSTLWQRPLAITIGIGAMVLAVSVVAVVPAMQTLARASESRPLDEGRFRALAQRSTVYDTQGNVLAVLGKENRQAVDLEEVPQIIQDAVIAVEDQTFWTNEGVDVNGMIRAAVNNISSGEVQGGSTITQQLVKNRILSPKRNLRRKMREIVLALRIDDAYSKREILEQYLNTVYFGQGSYGVRSAVERYFLTQDPGAPLPRSKRLDEVTLAEAALLAGLIANPEGNNPFSFPEGAQARRTLALGRMVDQGYITPEDAVAAEQEPLPVIMPTPELRPRDAWAEEVQDRLIHDPMYSALGKTEQERESRVLTGGLGIHATLDPKMQAAANAAMAAILPEKPGFTGVLVAMDPRTGAVRAMVAGPGFEQSQYNIATSAPGRQAGSTWKVITLAAALEYGFSPNDRVSGSSPCDFEERGKTQNAEGGGGSMTLRSATVNSVNCAYARTELAVGFDAVIANAHEMGITQQTLQPILTLTLGTIESTPLEMATVASTIASGGIHHDPVFVSKITDPDGTVLFDSSALQGKRAMTAEVAACEIDMLRGVITGGTGTAARLGNRPVFGKTGTTDNKADANFLGATPQLAAFVWHGNAQARVPGAGFGGQIPARIFQAFMEGALAGEPALDFPAAGPVCDRPGKFIDPAGRSENDPGGLRHTTTSTSTPLITVPIDVLPPPTGPPPTTTPPTTPTTSPTDPLAGG